MHEPVNIESQRCYLTQLKSIDKQDIEKLYANVKVRQFLGGVIIQEAFEAKFYQLLAPSMAMNWVVRLKETGVFVGLVSINKHHDEQEQEVSYQIMPDFWGNSFGAEVVGAAIEYANKIMQLSGIVAETQAGNTASRKLLEKLGMSAREKVSRFGEEQIIYFKDLKEPIVQKKAHK